MAQQTAFASEKKKISQESLDRAKSIMSRRYRHVTDRSDLFKTLARMGLTRVAREMETPAPPMEPKQEVSDVRPVKLDPIGILSKELQLPAMPQVFLELQEAINAPNTSADDLARIISQDPSLTAFLLRMVNSAFYSLPMQIDTISRAVTVVGVNQLSTLAVGTSVLDLFKDVPTDMIDMERFWKHSIAVGIIARGLCRLTGRGDPERSFVAGLLHDIGQLALFKAIPDHAAAAMIRSREKHVMLYVAEQEMIGFDHAMLGGMLLRKWNFPFVLVSAVLEHHAPRASQKEAEPGLVHCAEVIASGMGIGSSREYFVQPPEQSTWDSLELSIEDLEGLGRTIDEELEEAFSILVDHGASRV